MSESKELSDFKELSYMLVDSLEFLGKKGMNNHGDTCDVSQHICLLESLEKVHMVVNGTEEEDIREMELFEWERFNQNIQRIAKMSQEIFNNKLQEEEKNA